MPKPESKLLVPPPRRSHCKVPEVLYLAMKMSLLPAEINSLLPIADGVLKLAVP